MDRPRQQTASEEQTREERARVFATIATMRATFADAKNHKSRAVSLSMQVDMLDPTHDVPFENVSVFKPLVEELVKQSKAFDGPGYLFNGDLHVYNSDKPLAGGSKWLTFYGLKSGANNLTRVIVDPSDNKDWLKVLVVHGPEVLTWQRVPYQRQAG